MNHPGLATPAATLSPAELDELVSLSGPDEAAADFVPSPERVRREVADLLAAPLSPALSRWSDGYAAVGRRNPYLWGWCARAVRVTTLPCVSPEWSDDVCDTKTLGVMFDVMLDDLADQQGNGELLEGLLRLMDDGSAPDLSGCPADVRRYAEFTCELWREIDRRGRRYPLSAEFAPLLRFDYLQLSNVMRYSHLLNASLDLLNLAEHDLYTPHNMHIMICSTFDLMCSPGFDRAELGKLREIIWNAQWMGRIGNLVTTWQRELGEGDFTSGVYARAVSVGDLSVDQLRSGDRGVIERTILERGHEHYFLQRWQAHRRFLLSAADRFHSFDLNELLKGFERLICLHLGSRGYK